MPQTSSRHTFIQRLWHWPAQLRWMDPLPVPHRRAIMLTLLIVLLAFLWPTPAPRSTPAPASPSATEVPLQAELVDPAEPAAPDNDPAPAASDSEGSWRSYRVAAGQTLAQLFRDNNLPVNDVFAMAREEGSDKPLSSLSAGQAVKIRQDAQGVVTALSVEGSSGPVLFTRQPDGSFLRAQ
ncbi:OapA family protein [Pantoea sp. 1.19]|uniref:OapA family protein n=1 Tax=Pantoea sp. 1.19 TaxID=1925589 RepID=UPI000948BF52|nr:LysM-like peptidoglycan-binding domain-containing protein [Pantoea sp. 1.19]